MKARQCTYIYWAGSSLATALGPAMAATASPAALDEAIAVVTTACDEIKTKARSANGVSFAD